MSWEDASGVMGDITLRIELKRLADRAAALDNRALGTILDLAVATLDSRISDSGLYPRGSGGPGARRRGSVLVCRNVRVEGRRTSLKLENDFWQALDRMAAETDGGIDELCDMARRQYPDSSLASAVRVFVLNRALGLAPAPPRPEVG